MTEKPNPQRGNVMFYILIAVALLAALIFAVSQSGRGSAKHVSEEKLRLLANSVIEYSGVVANAVAQLRLRGCKNSELSFENSTDASYVNAGAPADKICHVFSIVGGGITFQYPPAQAIAGGAPKHMITGGLEVEEIGSTCGGNSCTELLIATGPLLESVCVEINNIMGIDNPGGSPPADQVDFIGQDEYIGTLAYGATFGDEPASADLTRKTAACMRDQNDTLFYFYKVLLAR